MKFYSTNKKSPLVNFRDATIKGQAPDKGLYFPESIPQIDPEILDSLKSISNEEIAFQVIKPYIGSTIPTGNLIDIVAETINFPIPLVELTDRIFSLELFHGPTLAFKDVGARFMSRCLGYFVSQGIHEVEKAGKITVLVATSGDTGGAVASGFYDVEGVEVIILYPSGKVSPVQEKQLTAMGKNIHALEVKGNFDDCQRMVKQAFLDDDIAKKRFLTSANSINIARWLPQQFYYFFAIKQWADLSMPPVISVPSGNFGNICAGILAMQSGLPVKHFIAACNVNDVVHQYLVTEQFIPKAAIATYSNAMDVGDPSNFTRILEIFHHQFPQLKADLSAASITDNETLATISRVAKENNYVLDPHGAVGYLALERYLEEHKTDSGIFLETAHPVKFPGPVEEATGKKVEIPAGLKALLQQSKSAKQIDPVFEQLKEFLLQT